MCRTQRNLLLTGTGNVVNVVPSERIQHIKIVCAFHDIVVFVKQHGLSLPVLLDAEVRSEADTGQEDYPQKREYKIHHAVIVAALAGNFGGILFQSLQPLHKDFLIGLESIHLLLKRTYQKAAFAPFPAEMTGQLIHPELKFFKFLGGCTAAHRVALGILSDGTSGGQRESGTGHAGSGTAGIAVRFLVLVHQGNMALAVIRYILTGIILNHHVRTGKVGCLHRSSLPILLGFPDAVVFSNNVIPAGLILPVKLFLLLIPLLLLGLYGGNFLLLLSPGKLQLRKLNFLHKSLVESLLHLPAALRVLQFYECFSGNQYFGIRQGAGATERLGIETQYGGVNLIRVKILIVILGKGNKMGKGLSLAYGMSLPGLHKLSLGNHRNSGLGNNDIGDGFKRAEFVRILEFGSIVLFGGCSPLPFPGSSSGASVRHGG